MVDAREAIEWKDGVNVEDGMHENWVSARLCVIYIRPHTIVECL